MPVEATETTETTETKMDTFDAEFQEVGFLEGKHEDGWLRDVPVLGFKSANGREYTKAAMEQGKGLYEGADIYVDHALAGAKARVANDHFGRLHNVRLAESGLRGDVQYLTSHPLTTRVQEDVQKKLNFFGLSHNIDGRARKDNGKEIIEAITRVKSVDLVTGPATVKGLTETKVIEPKVDEVNIKAIVEAAIKPLSDEIAELKKSSKREFKYLMPKNLEAPLTEQGSISIPKDKAALNKWLHEE